ncbi:hypothetical protein CPC16_005318 [Podila verticillata]|nr:hypothetical protein CPC16_005318 [Podila verticillata]
MIIPNCANVVSDGSFMGITKKDIDDEFQKLIDQLAEKAIKASSVVSMVVT